VAARERDERRAPAEAAARDREGRDTPKSEGRREEEENFLDQWEGRINKFWGKKLGERGDWFGGNWRGRMTWEDEDEASRGEERAREGRTQREKS
jgi:hypothetical protein